MKNLSKKCFIGNIKFLPNFCNNEIVLCSEGVQGFINYQNGKYNWACCFITSIKGQLVFSKVCTSEQVNQNNDAENWWQSIVVKRELENLIRHSDDDVISSGYTKKRVASL